MLGRNGNIAYVRYDSQGRIVPGGPIVQAKPPKVGNWQAVSDMLGTNVTGTNGNFLRSFIRLDMFGRVVPSSLIISSKKPGNANSGTDWIEINSQYRGSATPTTTTTTTTIQPSCEYVGGGSANFEGYYSTTSTSTTLPIYTINIYARHNGGPGRNIRLYYGLTQSLDNYVDLAEEGFAFTVNATRGEFLYIQPRDVSNNFALMPLSFADECYLPFGLEQACVFSVQLLNGSGDFYISINDQVC